MTKAEFSNGTSFTVFKLAFMQARRRFHPVYSSKLMSLVATLPIGRSLAGTTTDFSGRQRKHSALPTMLLAFRSLDQTLTALGQQLNSRVRFFPTTIYTLQYLSSRMETVSELM